MDKISFRYVCSLYKKEIITFASKETRAFSLKSYIKDMQFRKFIQIH
jgi:hypothetical protein